MQLGLPAAQRVQLMGALVQWRMGGPRVSVGGVAGVVVIHFSPLRPADPAACRELAVDPRAGWRLLHCTELVWSGRSWCAVAGGMVAIPPPPERPGAWS